MEFIGTITQVKEVSGQDKYGTMYHGVEATVMELMNESDIEARKYQNKATVYIKDATLAQFPVGTSIVVEARTDIQIAQSGRKYTTVNMHYVSPAIL